MLEAFIVMPQEVTRVFLCLAGGELLSELGRLPFPGAVVGLVLLIIDLEIIGHVPEDLGKLADGVLGMLGMLFVPAGVGVLAYADLLRTEMIPIAAAIVGGTAVTIGVTMVAADRLVRASVERPLGETPEVVDARA